MFLFVPPDAKSIIKNEVPQKFRAKFVPFVQRGYKLAATLLNQVPFLDWDLGECHEGYLRRIAVHFVFKKAIDDGELPFSYTYEYNRNRSHRYMVIHTRNAKITLSQVQDKYSIARHAYFREKLQEANQISMVLDEGAIPITSSNTEYYLLLTFSSGGEEPAFINLGLPNGKGWADRINLLTEPRVVDTDTLQEEEEVISQEQLVGFRKYIQEVEEGGN